jgi:hypothetical protein
MKPSLILIIMLTKDLIEDPVEENNDLFIMPFTLLYGILGLKIIDILWSWS